MTVPVGADKVAAESIQPIVNVASVPQRSPFRYPGGKTWLIPVIRRWLRNLKPPVEELVEPFAGGAIVSLTAVFENLARRTTMVELDDEVAAAWKAILYGHGSSLADRVTQFELSGEAIAAVLKRAGDSLQDAAFATIVKNRIARGGILAAGAGVHRNGENGKGLSSRWYPTTLGRRVLAISKLRDRIRFIHGDGVGVMRSLMDIPDIAFFVDPPYSTTGRRLYTHSEVNHEELFALASKVKGNVLITYDDATEIRHLAIKSGFDIREVPMKSTHHIKKMELLIGRNLNWFDDEQQVTLPEFALQMPLSLPGSHL